MADVTIESSAYLNINLVSLRGGIFWTSPTVGYIVYVNSSIDLGYRKTTNGGATWSEFNTLLTGTIYYYDCWADWQTPGDNGTKIHFVGITGADNSITYGYIDTASDAEYTDIVETCQGSGTLKNSSGVTVHFVSITKTRGGNLAVALRYTDSNSDHFSSFYTSSDGDTWNSKTSLWESWYYDLAILYPANLADDNDVWALFWDVSANEISLKTFDDSANSWSEATFAGSMADNYYYLQMDGVIRHSDGHLLFMAWSQYDNADADLMVWDITDAGTITAKTNVLTDSAESFLSSLFINQATDDVYSVYARGTTVPSAVKIYYKKSTDGMATWGDETAIQANAEDEEIWISCGAVKKEWGGKFLPVWFNEDLDYLFCNTDNGISLLSLAPVVNKRIGMPSRCRGHRQAFFKRLILK